jgi:hypothetical protein
MSKCNGYIFLILLLISACNKHSISVTTPNLLVNGSAEIPDNDSMPAGWTIVQGSWKGLLIDSNTGIIAVPKEGKNLFFEGQDSLGILQQDIYVGQFGQAIDNHERQFIFSGYVQSLDQGSPSDQTKISVTCLDSLKRNALYTFNSEVLESKNDWHKITDSFVAPASTRFVRIQLTAVRWVGMDNDGYFDNIRLVSATQQSAGYSLWIVIIIIIVVVIAIVILMRRKTPALVAVQKEQNVVKPFNQAN